MAGGVHAEPGRPRSVQRTLAHTEDTEVDMLRWIALLILVAAAPLQPLAQSDATAVENPAFG